MVSNEAGVRHYLPHPVAVVSTVDQFQDATLIGRHAKVEVQLLPDPDHHYAIALEQVPFSDDSFEITLSSGQILASADVSRTSQAVEVAKFLAKLVSATSMKMAVKVEERPGVPPECQMVPHDAAPAKSGPRLWLENVDKSLDRLLAVARTDPDGIKTLQGLLDSRDKVEPLAAPEEKVVVTQHRKVVFLAKGSRPEDVLGTYKAQCWSALVFAELVEPAANSVK